MSLRRPGSLWKERKGCNLRVDLQSIHGEVFLFAVSQPVGNLHWRLLLRGLLLCELLEQLIEALLDVERRGSAQFAQDCDGCTCKLFGRLNARHQIEDHLLMQLFCGSHHTSLFAFYFVRLNDVAKPVSPDGCWQPHGNRGNDPDEERLFHEGPSVRPPSADPQCGFALSVEALLVPVPIFQGAQADTGFDLLAQMVERFHLGNGGLKSMRLMRCKGQTLINIGGEQHVSCSIFEDDGCVDNGEFLGRIGLNDRGQTRRVGTGWND